jgi:hypothetical protein
VGRVKSRSVTIISAEPVRLLPGDRQQFALPNGATFANRQRSGGTEGWQPPPHQKTGILKKAQEPGFHLRAIWPFCVTANLVL